MSDANTTVGQLRELVASFVAERDWEQFHDAKNLAASIAIETAELMEHFQWLRSDQLDEVKRDTGRMSEIREELADITAFLLSFANAMDIDVSEALRAKMLKNADKYPAGEFRGRFER